MDKSNIVVFRKGGFLSVRERWTFGEQVLKVVNVYKYLGLIFSTRLSFRGACQDLASKAKKGTLCILQKLRMFDHFSLSVFLRLFDSQIQPVLLYGAEIWGLSKVATDVVEKAHLFALKKFLGVANCTPNDLVYSETNRFPITMNGYIRCIRYWLKLTRMECHRLPYKAYQMLFNLDVKGKNNWVTSVRLLLCSNGFGFVWANQGVENVNAFVISFRRRLLDCRLQEWDAHVQSSERFSFFSSFCSRGEVAMYMNLNLDKHLQFIMTRFRFGISDLATHKYRYKRHVEEDLVCPLCKEHLEDEIHFVLKCPALSELRKQYIKEKYFVHPNSFKLAMLLASKNEIVVKKLAIFLYRAFKFRSIVLS